MQAIKRIKAQLREKVGTKASRRLRGRGLIPAVIYGHGQEPIPVAVGEHELTVALSRAAHLLEVELDGATSQCLIKEVQYDHLGIKPVHVDLARVSLDERVQVTVPVELRGTPAGVAEGGVLEQLMMELEVECVVTQIPEAIRAHVGGLGLNQSLYVRDLDLPSGLRALAEADEPVCIVRMLGEEPTEEQAEAPAEPEVIGREERESEQEGS